MGFGRTTGRYRLQFLSARIAASRIDATRWVAAYFREQEPHDTMSRNRLLFLLVLGNILGIGGTAIMAVIDIPAVIPVVLFLLLLDVRAILCICRAPRCAATNVTSVRHTDVL
jgi:hypothetical protein